MGLGIEQFRKLALGSGALAQGAVADARIQEAILIREVEETFLKLFSLGRMNGTVHTCTGQEFFAIAVGQLQDDDWVTSSHRCHGHFISKTGNWRGLVDELMGLKSGVCMGIGSSQHLYARGFLSNGPQAALVPVATGIALEQKRAAAGAVTASFIGEGTLGEGVLYEALNLASVLQVPQLFVCENNLYSQSTAQSLAVSGSIAARAQAFGIRCFEGNTWDPARLMAVAAEAIAFVRTHCAPAFLVVRTYRLNAHSKGDDDRDREEVEYFRRHDPLNVLLREPKWQAERERVAREIEAHIAGAGRRQLTRAEYARDQLPRKASARRVPVVNRRLRMVQALNQAYGEGVARGACHIGEDILDPYGGAFKVTRGWSANHPQQLIGSPISEAGIAGVATGLALMGRQTFVEIMFGDFCTNIFDQLINNMSKMHHMYAFQASVPARIRTPMGGKRGYGPTHSQSLEKFLAGIDNVALIALTSLVDPAPAIAALDRLPGPAVIIESKVDYGKFLWEGTADFSASQEADGFGSVVISPARARPNVTLVAYGETARAVADHLPVFFDECDLLVELVVPLLLHPLNLAAIERSVRGTGHLVVIEDGSVAFGIGAEIIAQLAERGIAARMRRIGAEPYPIPSVAALEQAVLPTVEKILAELAESRAAIA
ncbi:MAG: thiamine pyrophosphate-dependent enzyme [Rhodospirillales bacterium]